MVRVGELEYGARDRAFVHIKSGYQPLSVVLECPDKSDELLDIALRELRAFRAKYARLRELAGVFVAMDEIE